MTVRELKTAHEVLLGKIAQPTVRLPGLGAITCDDYDFIASFGPMERALIDACDELRAQGHDEDHASDMGERALVLLETARKMGVAEIDDRMFSVAATLRLPFGNRTFPAAQFLKALKQTV